MNRKKIRYLLVFIILIFLAYFTYARLEEKNSQQRIQKISQEIVYKVDERVKEDEILPSQEVSESSVIKENDKILKLREEFENKDIVGYLSINDTTIDYPVLQTADNEFYLNHDAYSNESKAGSIFLDYENNIEILDYNTVIYGHNMHDDIMFHSLRNYIDEAYFREHKVINFTTLYNEYVYEIFSVYETDVDFPYITVLFNSNEEFYELSSQFKEKSIYETNININENDKIITLSTCSYFSGINSNKRFVVQGKLITINGEKYN